MSQLASSLDAAVAATAAGGLAQVRLKPRKARPFFGRHPWVLDSAVDHVEGVPADGEAVDLVTDAGKFIARGLYNSRSRIRVRLYSWDAGLALNREFWKGRLSAALALRWRMGLGGPHSGTRLVFSEADGLSGLVVDRFDHWLSVQATALGIAVRIDELAGILVELAGPAGIYLRTEKGAAQSEGIALRDGLLWGTAPDGPVFIEEHSLRYGVDLAEGQKTGFYVDQRDNRLAAARYFAGRRVLDMFCYSGGFAMNAARGGATEVLAFDSSSKAVALSRANAELNGLTNLQVEQGEAFETLEQLASRGERFGGIVLDPPKFTRSRGAVEEALRAYHRLNRLAVEILEPGGILVTCSCSGHVSREDFLYMLVGVAQQTKRDLQILEQRGAAPDHPVSATCLEGEYLKCFICRAV